MKLNSSLNFLFRNLLLVSIIGATGLIGGVSYLKLITNGASEKAIAESILSFTKEAALYRDSSSINSALSAMHKDNYFFRVKLPNNFEVIYPKNLFSGVWETKPGAIIYSDSGSKEMLSIEVWNKNAQAEWVWDLIIYGASTVLILILFVSYFILKRVGTDVKGIEDYLQYSRESLRVDDFKFLFFKDLGRMIVSNEKLTHEIVEFKKEVEYKERVANLANMVCHDIKSPMAALKFLVSNFNLDDNEQKQIIKTVVSRIEKITEDLSKRHRNDFNQYFDTVKTINQITREKALEYNQVNFTLNFNNFTNLNSIYLYGDENLVGRGISNLINNAIEASIKGAEIKIDINLRVKENYLSIEIKDNGVGIPKNILDKVGQKGFSYNKEMGTGMGLYSFRCFVEQLGGKLTISSDQGHGTEINILYPFSDQYLKNNFMKNTLFSC